MRWKRPFIFTAAAFLLASAAQAASLADLIATQGSIGAGEMTFSNFTATFATVPGSPPLPNGCCVTVPTLNNIDVMGVVNTRDTSLFIGPILWSGSLNNELSTPTDYQAVLSLTYDISKTGLPFYSMGSSIFGYFNGGHFDVQNVMTAIGSNQSILGVQTTQSSQFTGPTITFSTLGSQLHINEQITLRPFVSGCEPQFAGSPGCLVVNWFSNPTIVATFSSTVPEPSTLTLVGPLALALAYLRRGRSRK